MGSETECVARYGGEEFIALWNGVAAAKAAALAERLRQAVEALNKPHAASSCSGVVSLSVGVAIQQAPRAAASAPNDEVQHEVEAIVRLADQRLYAAKAAGRNRVMA
jgi:diguanylate cyclase (GGDEF)-like protein